MFSSCEQIGKGFFFWLSHENVLENRKYYWNVFMWISMRRNRYKGVIRLLRCRGFRCSAVFPSELRVRRFQECTRNLEGPQQSLGYAWLQCPPVNEYALPLPGLDFIRVDSRTNLQYYWPLFSHDHFSQEERQWGWPEPRHCFTHPLCTQASNMKSSGSWGQQWVLTNQFFALHYRLEKSW